MKYRTLELIGSLILAGVAAAMASQAHAAPVTVDDCVAFGKYSAAVDRLYDSGTFTLPDALQAISMTAMDMRTRDMLERLAVTGWKHHRSVTPEEAGRISFESCVEVAIVGSK